MASPWIFQVMSPLIEDTILEIPAMADDRDDAFVANLSNPYQNISDDANFTQPELGSFYRHSTSVTILYCIACKTIALNMYT